MDFDNFEDNFEEEYEKSLENIAWDKKRIASQLKKDKKKILEVKGNYKYKKRFFLIRKFEILWRNLKHFFYRMIS